MMLSRLLKPLWYFLALMFLIEAWLWDRLQPVVAWVVARIPLRAIKAWLREHIARLTPAATLVVFLIPVAVLFPFKIAAVWLLAHERWFAAALVLLGAKLAGVGVTAFIFDATRPKLLQMPWFHALYDVVLRVRAWAHELVEPLMARIRAAVARSRAGALRRFFVLAQRLRRVVQRARAG